MLLKVKTLWFFTWVTFSQLGGLHVSWDHGGGIRADSQGGGGDKVSIQSLSACTLPASWRTESDRMKP